MLGKTTEYTIRALDYIYILDMEGESPGFKENRFRLYNLPLFGQKVSLK